MKTRAIPNRSECLRLMIESGMPPHIRRHSLVVAEIASLLARLSVLEGIRIDEDLVQAGALLHDIAKARSIETGENHSDVGAEMLEDLGLSNIAPIVRQHVTIDLETISGPLTESLIVNYADKRVKHDQVVTIEERFSDLMERYAMTEEQRARMMKRLKLYLRLERKIFERIPVKPSGPEIMNVSVAADKPKEGEE